MTIGEELKKPKGSRWVPVLLKNSFNDVGRGNEDTVFCDEEARPDRDKDSAWLLGDDREDCMNKFCVCPICRLGTIAAMWSFA